MNIEPAARRAHGLQSVPLGAVAADELAAAGERIRLIEPYAARLGRLLHSDAWTPAIFAADLLGVMHEMRVPPVAPKLVPRYIAARWRDISKLWAEIRELFHDMVRAPRLVDELVSADARAPQDQDEFLSRRSKDRARNAELYAFMRPFVVALHRRDLCDYPAQHAWFWRSVFVATFALPKLTPPIRATIDEARAAVAKGVEAPTTHARPIGKLDKAEREMIDTILSQILDSRPAVTLGEFLTALQRDPFACALCRDWNLRTFTSQFRGRWKGAGSKSRSKFPKAKAKWDDLHPRPARGVAGQHVEGA
jgi:hypothetical protein